MDIQKLTAFFKWCTIINGGLLILSVLVFIAIPDFIYSIHGTWFPMERESFNTVSYGFLGLFNIVVLVFNLTPWLVLLIIQDR